MPPVLPINITELVAVVLGCLMVLIPVAGLTARFAVKPIVEALGRARESTMADESVALLERRTALLEQEVQNLTATRAQLDRLVEELEFQRQLQSSESANAADPAARSRGGAATS
jgi:hypothetical protein